MIQYRRSPAFTLRRVAGEVVLVPLSAGAVAGPTPLDFVVLNDTAEQLWEHLVEARTEDDLARHLMSLYSIPAAQARSDLRVFLDAMCDLGALTTADLA